MHTVAISGYELEFKNMLNIIFGDDLEYNKLREKSIKRSDITEESAYQIDAEGFLCYKNCIYVPNQSNIKQIIFRELHDNPCARHLGYQKLISALKKDFYWPNMKKEAVDYVARCFRCQQVKVVHQHPGGLLQPIPILEWKWETITMDFITGLPKTRKQHDSIMVVVVKLSKAIRFIPAK